MGPAPTRGVLTVRAALFAQRAGLLDITDGERIGLMAADVLARYGRVDVLVNNADRTHVGLLSRRLPTGSCVTCSHCTCSAPRV